MNDIDIQMAEMEARAVQIEDLPCGCWYDHDYGETVVRCDEHRRQARFVGGTSEYVIDGRPL